MRRVLIIGLAVIALISLIGAAAVWLVPAVVTANPNLAKHLPVSMQRWPSIYLRVALSQIEDRGMPRDPVYWPTVLEEGKEITRGAKTTADMYGAIRLALDRLGAGRGMLQEPSPPGSPLQTSAAYGVQVIFPERVVASVFPASPADVAGIRAGDIVERVNDAAPVVSPDPRLRGEFVDIPRPRVRLRLRSPGAQTAREVTLEIGTFGPLPGHTARVGMELGYVDLPGTTGDEDFALRVRTSIARIDGPDVCGWIVDLRHNNGGPLPPALIALRAILGEGSLGGTIRPDGRQPFTYPPPREGDPPPVPLVHPNPSIAVLISRLTSTVVLFAFKARPATRFFGEPTSGLLSARTLVGLIDGAKLDLATTAAFDRTGQEYWDRVDPDQPVATDWARIGTPDDPVIVAAAAWLKSQPGCRPR
jgi:carboxyl-terminal processing protease